MEQIYTNITAFIENVANMSSEDWTVIAVAFISFLGTCGITTAGVWALIKKLMTALLASLMSMFNVDDFVTAFTENISTNGLVLAVTPIIEESITSQVNSFATQIAETCTEKYDEKLDTTNETILALTQSMNIMLKRMAESSAYSTDEKIEALEQYNANTALIDKLTPVVEEVAEVVTTAIAEITVAE